MTHAANKASSLLAKIMGPPPPSSDQCEDIPTQFKSSSTDLSRSRGVVNNLKRSFSVPIKDQQDQSAQHDSKKRHKSIELKGNSSDSETLPHRSNTASPSLNMSSYTNSISNTKQTFTNDSSKAIIDSMPGVMDKVKRSLAQDQLAQGNSKKRHTSTELISNSSGIVTLPVRSSTASPSYSLGSSATTMSTNLNSNSYQIITNESSKTIADSAPSKPDQFKRSSSTCNNTSSTLVNFPQLGSDYNIQSTCSNTPTNTPTNIKNDIQTAIPVTAVTSTLPNTKESSQTLVKKEFEASNIDSKPAIATNQPTTTQDQIVNLLDSLFSSIPTNSPALLKVSSIPKASVSLEPVLNSHPEKPTDPRLRKQQNPLGLAAPNLISAKPETIPQPNLYSATLPLPTTTSEEASSSSTLIPLESVLSSLSGRPTDPRLRKQQDSLGLTTPRAHPVQYVATPQPSMEPTQSSSHLTPNQSDLPNPQKPSSKRNKKKNKNKGKKNNQTERKPYKHKDNDTSDKVAGADLDFDSLLRDYSTSSAATALYSNAEENKHEPVSKNKQPSDNKKETTQNKEKAFKQKNPGQKQAPHQAFKNQQKPSQSQAFNNNQQPHQHATNKPQQQQNRPNNTSHKESSKVCRFFKVGACLRAEECTFSHNLRLEPCRFFHLNQRCSQQDCPYSHEPLTEDSLERLRELTGPCRFYHFKGYCHTPMCPFSHKEADETELKKAEAEILPCRYFHLYNKCNAGSECFFLHDEATPAQIAQLKK